jgi:sulfur-oxidizing protein SoxZ
MAQAHLPRVRVPSGVKAGDIVEIKTLIAHEMETGQRRDGQGKPIPRKIINRFTATFEGREVFRADWYSSISANPYQSFFLKATKSGLLEFIWKDDDGSEYRTSARLIVAS